MAVDTSVEFHKDIVWQRSKGILIWAHFYVPPISVIEIWFNSNDDDDNEKSNDSDNNDNYSNYDYNNSMLWYIFWYNDNDDNDNHHNHYNNNNDTDDNFDNYDNYSDNDKSMLWFVMFSYFSCWRWGSVVPQCPRTGMQAPVAPLLTWF